MMKSNLNRHFVSHQSARDKVETSFNLVFLKKIPKSGKNLVGKKVNTQKVNTRVILPFIRKYPGFYGYLKLKTFLLSAVGFYIIPSRRLKKLLKLHIGVNLVNVIT